MALSAFADKARPPAAADLAEMLGKSSKHWNDLHTHVARTYAPIEPEWSFASAKFGWSLRLKQKKRVVLYLIPGEGRFLAGTVLGDRALAIARESGLPAKVLTLVNEAPRYAEGTGLRLEIRTTADVAAVRKLLAAKMA